MKLEKNVLVFYSTQIDAELANRRAKAELYEALSETQNKKIIILKLIYITYFKTYLE